MRARPASEHAEVMGVKISGQYLGEKKVRAVHELSGTELITAAPLDNEGDGSSFSPTDLAATSMATCMLTIMAIAAEKRGIDLTGARFEAEKHMNASPRYIRELPVSFFLPSNLDTESRALLEKAAMTCPVHRSFADFVNIKVSFDYSL